MSNSELISFFTGLSLLLDKNTRPEIGSPISRSGLNVAGQTVYVAGETLEIYAYASDTEIEHDIRALSFQAQLWGKGSSSTPYCFRKERKLLLYTGRHPQVIGWLTRLWGTCFLRP